MLCKNSEILYVFLFLILFVVSHFLLIQYYMKDMSIGKKRRINAAKISSNLQSTRLNDNSHIPTRNNNGSFMQNREHHRYRNIHHRSIIEPALTGLKEAEYALNTFYFQKSMNYTFFELM